MDVPYTKKEKELLKYMAAGYTPISQAYYPDHNRMFRKKKMDFVLSQKGPYMYGGYDVTREQYIRQSLYTAEADSDSLTELELVRAKKWAKSKDMDLRDNPAVSDAGSALKYIVIAIFVLALFPLWPVLIIMVLVGGITGGARFWD